MTHMQCTLLGTSKVHFVAAERQDYSFVRAMSTALNRTVTAEECDDDAPLNFGQLQNGKQFSYTQTEVVRVAQNLE
ncbi:unnamed protein product [Macrosiphum euphorbiae]|uniref:Uncharacterized protein n=1 Tax=Macrosiphum euphorbiae TaxID=13131 RepID=A0AAV0XGD7_9HEMI|nr:unnamed protein product [Macrosiphum euphorbiae]